MAVDEVQPTMPLWTRTFIPNYAMVSVASNNGDAYRTAFSGLDVVSSRIAHTASDGCHYLYITRFFLDTRFQLGSKMYSDMGEKIDNCETVECNLKDVRRYVRSKEYCTGLSKVQKRRIREKASSFTDHEGVLMRKNKLSLFS